jgi:hypothetical protein
MADARNKHHLVPNTDHESIQLFTNQFVIQTTLVKKELLLLFGERKNDK